MNLGFLNQTQLHRGHRAFGFCYKIDMLNLAIIESNRPVRVVMPNRGRDEETVRQLHIYSYIGVGIQFRCEISLVCGIVYDMVIQVLVCLHCIYAQFALDGRVGENIGIIMLIKNIIGDMLNNSSSFFIIDERSCFDDKLFWIIFKLLENRLLNATKIAIISLRVSFVS